MNILLITYQGDTAGSTNSIAYLAKGLADKGHQVFVGCRKESLLFNMLQNSKVITLPMTFRSRFDWKNVLQIKNAVKKHQIQIVNAQSSYDRYTSVLSRQVFGLKCKVIHTRRQISKSMGGFLQNFFYYRGTNKIIAVSEGVKQSLVEKKIPAQHIEVIYNGTPLEKYQQVDTDMAEHYKKKYQIVNSDFVIGCVSRRKKQEQILQALQEIEFKTKVLFVGIAEDEELSFLATEVKGKHSIFYTGIVSEKEVINHCKLMHCMILPSVQEGLSQALLEAMAMEVPVIATRAGGNPELINNGENGFVFEDGDIKSLASQIERVKLDADLVAKFKQEGKKTALQKFSIENTINNYEYFFKSLLSEHDAAK